MKTIIATTSLTERCLHVTDYATDMAVNIKAELLLLHIVQIPSSFDTTLAGYEYASVLENAEADMAVLKKNLLLRAGCMITITSRVVTGTLQEEIEEVCSANRPFIVIAGTERESFTDRFLFGSNTFSIVKNLHYPVLLVPPGAIFNNIKKIVLTSDCEDIEQAPTDIIRQMAELFNASVDIVNVIRSSNEENKNAVSCYLLAKQFADFNPQTNFIISDNTGQAIHDYALEHQDDLVIVIARKHNFLASLVHKSQSGKIALQQPVPVLAIAE